MSLTKLQAEPQTKATPATTIDNQPALPEKRSGPVRPGMVQRASALPPPNGTPPAARAGGMMSDQAGLGAPARARMSAALQRQTGNARMKGGLGTTVQAKLAVGAPNDEYEQQADKAADRVMRMAQPVPEKERHAASASDGPSKQEIKTVVQRAINSQPAQSPEDKGDTEAKNASGGEDEEGKFSEILAQGIEIIAAEQAVSEDETRLASIDVSGNQNRIKGFISNYKKANPGADPVKIHAAEKEALDYVVEASEATTSKQIYSKLRQAGGIINKLYGKNVLDVQAHHLDRVSENPATFESDRKVRIRAKLQRKVKQLQPQERKRLLKVSKKKRLEIMRLWVEQVFEQDVEIKGSVSLKEIGMILIPRDVHLGTIHAEERKEKANRQDIYEPTHTTEE